MKKNIYKLFYLTPLILCLFFPWQVILILSSIFALFFFTHLKYSNLKIESFDITPNNKEPHTPMNWYKEEIISQMTILRWELISNQEDTMTWVPRGQARVMENNFIMIYSPYIITIKGSRNMVTMMKSFLDIEKIFL